MVRITVIAGKEKFIFDYEGFAPLTVGRLPSCELQVSHNDVSREHCTIEPDGGRGFRIKDLESRNGVFVNGARISGKGPLPAGSVIQLSPDVKLTFGEAGAAPASAAAPAPVGVAAMV
ncbi:MAG TPA: FHA domain-containing protein, partial [Planctomycetota bacterium]|nr:FHA domain-containing protein [Planctomycetota bacterium]